MIDTLLLLVVILILLTTIAFWVGAFFVVRWILKPDVEAAKEKPIFQKTNGLYTNKPINTKEDADDEDRKHIRR